ncbi:arsenosugar biosynthesis radical SAM (seleno)protein ArsS [Parapedobacter indicus]|uniref:Radical SAM/Cys-rich domain-containing protein n=1 Tax=Parapedobacter indicus TaxID=1477437 RepID=A0A1I3CPE4_9SPHI|nr:arsenosugar biosynthesis radical SAM (seleno)protein ArsS [Parapedobacter indicus]PPL04329.1 radical SAM/Cys-rich protein [Parapedobacter indicus]SFH76101.1 radical SAM/Cys-rich domain-containing protein [Parapedobacter indicus]
MKSLKAQHHSLADARAQLAILVYGQDGSTIPISFRDKLAQSQSYPLKPGQIDTLQINIGKMCNQTCKHCHVDAGPDRKEIMTAETMQQCLDVLRQHEQLTVVDITGGAPEMNPNFRWFVEQLTRLDKQVIVRCNLTIIVANKKYADLPDFYRKHRVEVVSSLPFYAQDRTDRQRGDGVFDASIRALQLLNRIGYGKEGSGLKLNLVYNPSGAFLPSGQTALEKTFREVLRQRFSIEFNELFVITNMPISRFLDYLLMSGNYENYMEKLIHAYNPAAAANVMCRNTLSVGWDGYLYDCDFNQMLELKVNCLSQHIREFNDQMLKEREIVVDNHCYGCTAGSGSSCGGTIA